MMVEVRVDRTYLINNCKKYHFNLYANYRQLPFIARLTAH